MKKDDLRMHNLKFKTDQSNLDTILGTSQPTKSSKYIHDVKGQDSSCHQQNNFRIIENNSSGIHPELEQ